MIDKTIFLIWVIWYFNTYGTPPVLLNFLIRFYHFYDEYFTFCNRIVYPTYWDDDEKENDTEMDSQEKPKEPIKYEDKYLADIRTLDKDWVFTDEENTEIPNLIEEFCKGYIDCKVERIGEITNQITELEKEIIQDTDVVNFVENVNEDGDELIHENTLEERNEMRQIEINKLQEELDHLNSETNTDEGVNQIKNQSAEQARQYIIGKRLDRLSNCYVMEKTPVGNVIMIYQKDKESFKYYSDCNIPYRYLEVVGRKYVKLFNCRPIFIDMEEELRLFEEKWENEQAIRKLKEEERKTAEEAAKHNKPVEVKKNVFAKFKSYNKDAGGKISMAPPPKNNIPSKSVTETKENEKILLKEKANRYTYEGKIVNFNFLQKIERKVFNKKLGLSFADFKKMQKK